MKGVCTKTPGNFIHEQFLLHWLGTWDFTLFLFCLWGFFPLHFAFLIMYFILGYYSKCIITLTDFNTVSFIQKSECNHFPQIICKPSFSLSTTKVVRLIPALSFRTFQNELLESFVACLNPTPDTINWRISIGFIKDWRNLWDLIILQFLPEAESSWSSSCILWCILCSKPPIWSRNRLRAHPLPLWAEIICCTSLGGQADHISKISAGKKKKNKQLFCRFYTIAVLLSKHSQESKLIFVFDGNRDLPAMMGGWLSLFSSLILIPCDSSRLPSVPNTAM